MSMRSAFPRLVEMERRFGAVSRAVLARRWQGGRMPGRRLFSWQGGIGSLAKALATTLADMIRTGVAVRRIRRTAAGFRIEAGDAGTLEAVSVVLAAQPHAAAQILERIDDRLTRAIAGISAPPLAVVFLGYRRDQVEHPLDGVGYLTPESEGRLLTGAQFNSTMFPGRAPDGHVAVTGYLGGARAPDLARHPAEELVDLARTEFAELIGARGRPVVARVRQWALGLPQYGPGHAERVTRVVEETEGTAGLFVTGNYLRGPSIASCLAVAHETAAKVERFLQETGTARIAGRRQIGAARTYGHWRAEGGAR
jgi:oxygen-dependent protoporphyrinogen oxidase